MDELLSMLYVEGNILESFCRILIFAFCVDCCFGFGYTIRSIKGAVS